MSHDVFKSKLVHLKLNSVGFQQTDPGQGQRLDYYIAICADPTFLLSHQLDTLCQIFRLSNPAIDVMQSTKNRLAYNLAMDLSRARDR